MEDICILPVSLLISILQGWPLMDSEQQINKGHAPPVALLPYFHVFLTAQRNPAGPVLLGILPVAEYV